MSSPPFSVLINFFNYFVLQILQNIRDDIGDYPIWLSIDETTDSCGRYIANVVVGKLDPNEPATSHLISSKVLEQTNNSTIARAVRDALRKLHSLFVFLRKFKKVSFSQFSFSFFKVLCGLLSFYESLKNSFSQFLFSLFQVFYGLGMKMKTNF